MYYKHFSIQEREYIQQALWEKKSLQSIAEYLKRSPSSISRELRRNNPIRTVPYISRVAQEKAVKKRSCRGRYERLKNDVVRDYVVSHLKLGWSPEQIAGMIKKEKIGSISHEAIYQYIYPHLHRDGRGLLKLHKEDLELIQKNSCSFC